MHLRRKNQQSSCICQGCLRQRVLSPPEFVVAYCFCEKIKINYFILKEYGNLIIT